MLAGPTGNLSFGRARYHDDDTVDLGYRGWIRGSEDQSDEMIAPARSLPGEITIDASDRRFVADAERTGHRGWTSLAGAAIVLGLAAASACWMFFPGSDDVASPEAPPEQSVTSVHTKDPPTKGDRLALVAAASPSEGGRSPVLETRIPPHTSSVSNGDNKPSRSPADAAAKKTPSPPPQRTAAVDPKPEAPQTRVKLIAIPETRPGTIPGWAIRDVVDSTAILQGPTGVVRVARGDHVPGVGKVLTIVRWGNRWIVATSGGLISTR
jgi:hypothetical protein